MGIRNSSPDVVLINPHYVRRHGGGVVPPIGLCYLAAALGNEGATVRVIDLAARFPDYTAADYERPLSYLAEELADLEPALVGIGPLVTATLEPAAAIAAACRRQSKARLVLGGPVCAVRGAATALPELIDFDWMVAGDGETPIVELWRKGEAGPGTAKAGAEDPAPWREPDLDRLAVPARDLLTGQDYASSLRRRLSGSSMTSAFLSRGCPYSCSFCAAPLSSGKTVRRFSMPRVSEELNACAKLGFNEIVFYDDCLFVRSPKLDARIEEFAAALKASMWRGSYQLELRCDAVMAMSERTLKLLAGSGCRQINMGIEKGHVAALAAIRKRLTPDIARSAAERVSAAGIRAAGTFILGGPGEGPDDLDGTINFATSLDLDFAHFNPLALYPGTALFEQVHPDGDWLALCSDRELAPFGDILWRSETLPLGTILEAISAAYTEFYSEARLEQVCERLPAGERAAVSDAYLRLRSERAGSWEPSQAVRPELAA